LILERGQEDANDFVSWFSRNKLSQGEIFKVTGAIEIIDLVMPNYLPTDLIRETIDMREKYFTVIRKSEETGEWFTAYDDMTLEEKAVVVDRLIDLAKRALKHLSAPQAGASSATTQ
jgi:hypothetical protein